jgi:hypothetical protein
VTLSLFLLGEIFMLRVSLLMSSGEGSFFGLVGLPAIEVGLRIFLTRI